MAKNFRISASRNKDKLSLQLRGDFDGTSACELINILRERADGVVRVCIDTKGLKEVYPFGVDTFRTGLRFLKDRSFQLVFTEENTLQNAP